MREAEASRSAFSISFFRDSCPLLSPDVVSVVLRRARSRKFIVAVDSWNLSSSDCSSAIGFRSDSVFVSITPTRSFSSAVWRRRPSISSLMG